MIVEVLFIAVHHNNDPEVRSALDRVAPFFREASGCREVSFFADSRAGEYGTYSVWDSREELDAFTRSAPFQTLLGRLQPFLRRAPVAKVYDYYDPRPVPSGSSKQ